MPRRGQRRQDEGDKRENGTGSSERARPKPKLHSTRRGRRDRPSRRSPRAALPLHESWVQGETVEAAMALTVFIGTPAHSEAEGVVGRSGSDPPASPVTSSSADDQSLVPQSSAHPQSSLVRCSSAAEGSDCLVPQSSAHSLASLVTSSSADDQCPVQQSSALPESGLVSSELLIGC